MDRVPDPATAEARTVEKLIESFPTQIREIIETLRAVAKNNMPGTYEFVYHDAINYKLPDSPGTWICYIAAQRNYVRLGFYFGVNLHDPEELLEGTGKRMRHIKVKTAGDAGTNELAELIRQAWAHATNAAASSSFD
ncbi:DUF1801 domain-containing protein [Cohnella sp. CFH 77786]|uniref:DUF1801 domain-containing protein n=1 Tax=Cohnella sp. CFH 77786 TaxID=2662265 RepID=UPI001C61055B|nr:DUF1801 domain-containing protein [Cohnella sp. CFH 77786]